MRTLLLAILLLTPIERTITVVFVEPAGETLTAEEQHDVLMATEDAARWWEALSPIPTQLTIGATRFMTTTDDVYTALPIIPGDLTVFVLDNTVSSKLIQDHTEGAASYDLKAIWITTSRSTPMPVRMAHEFGHAVYNLPDFYKTPALCTLTDIMCMSQRDAYATRQIGCQSLAYLGYPCVIHRIYTPFVVWE